MRGGGQPLLIVILAWNRPESLRRLLNSLERADYGAGPASMEVRFALDSTGNTTMDSEMDAVIDALRWPHGDVLVRCARLRQRPSCLGSLRRACCAQAQDHKGWAAREYLGLVDGRRGPSRRDAGGRRRSLGTVVALGAGLPLSLRAPAGGRGRFTLYA
eukprot:scaffold125440_cov69-Phaeocystis_antarctica.AAC.3